MASTICGSPLYMAPEILRIYHTYAASNPATTCVQEATITIVWLIYGALEVSQNRLVSIYFSAVFYEIAYNAPPFKV